MPNWIVSLTNGTWWRTYLVAADNRLRALDFAREQANFNRDRNTKPFVVFRSEKNNTGATITDGCSLLEEGTETT
jgi:hypothetical protein